MSDNDIVHDGKLPTRYFIIRDGKTGPLRSSREITLQELKELKAYNNKIMDFYRFEELLVVSFNNLIDFNTALYSIADKNRYVTHASDSSFDWGIEVGSKIVNCLSAFCVYFSHVHTFLKNKQKENFDQEVATFISRFNNRRLFEQCKFLRNHSQHFGMFKFCYTTTISTLFMNRFSKVKVSVNTNDMILEGNPNQMERGRKTFSGIKEIDLYTLLAESFDLVQECQSFLRKKFENEYKRTCDWLVSFDKKFKGECRLGAFVEGERFPRRIDYVFVNIKAVKKTESLRKKHSCRCATSNTFLSNMSEEFINACKPHLTRQYREIAQQRDRFGGNES